MWSSWGSGWRSRAAALLLAVASAVAGRDARAQASADCAPACVPGETCVSGTCMVPSTRPPASPPASPPPAPVAPPVSVQVVDPETATSVEPPPPAATPTLPKGYAAPAYIPTPSLPDRERHGALFLPYLGLHSLQDSDDQGFDAGLRVGALLGGYVNEIWSLNAGVELDIFNFNSRVTDAGLDLSGEMLGLTFNPLVHLGNVKAEFVAGPKLGGFLRWVHAAGTGVVTGLPAQADEMAEGWTIGGDMGVFVAASRSVLVGALMSLEVRDLLHACVTATGMAESCQSSGPSATILGFTFGVLL
jgi:hypothetical protein